jgi:nitrite reductase (NO-forming)
MNKIKYFIFFIIVVIIFGCGRHSQHTSPANFQGISGNVLFKSKNCYTCHSIGKGAMVGPDLKGLFDRRDETWVKRFIALPEGMTQNDPIAIKLKEEYKTQMPNPSLTPEELNQLLVYLREATK